MASFLAGTPLIQNISRSLLMPRRVYYDQDIINHTLASSSGIVCESLYVQNQHGQKLRTSIFRHKNSICPNRAIIFLHGYGSNRMESLGILTCLPENYLLLAFDFSGSGKSEGNQNTFGAKQAQDIKPMIHLLHSQRFNIKSIVLWGRSMGAVAGLLYTCSNNSNDSTNRVDFQVIDSPFSAFDSIARQWAAQFMNLPNIIVSLGVQVLKKNFQNKDQQHNPFSIQLQENIKRCRTTTLFIYCQKDSVVSAQNSLRLIRNFSQIHKSDKGKILQGPQLCRILNITEDHNQLRKQHTIRKIVDCIQAHFQREQTPSLIILKQKELLKSVIRATKYYQITKMTTCSSTEKPNQVHQRRFNPKHKKGLVQVLSIQMYPNGSPRFHKQIKKVSGSIYCSLKDKNNRNIAQKRSPLFAVYPERNQQSLQRSIFLKSQRRIWVSTCQSSSFQRASPPKSAYGKYQIKENQAELNQAKPNQENIPKHSQKRSQRKNSNPEQSIQRQASEKGYFNDI